MQSIFKDFHFLGFSNLKTIPGSAKQNAVNIINAISIMLVNLLCLNMVTQHLLIYRN
jgi:hypothetical protein